MKSKSVLPVIIIIAMLALLSAGCTGHSGENDLLSEMSEFVVKANLSAEYYDNMVEYHSENATAWSIRAMYYNSNFNRSEALESVNRSLEIDPEFGVAWAVKGFILLNSGDEKGAQLCFDNAVKYDPSLAGSVPDLYR